jgi:hypothetical protein
MTRALTVVAAIALATSLAGAQSMNLIVNPQFDFHSFANSRSASASVYSSGNVAGWNTDAWGDITVTTSPHVEAVKPACFVRSLVAIKPGKRFYQVIFLPDIGVRHGDQVSLQVRGQQTAADSLVAAVQVLKVDSQTGKWKPSDYGMADTREFPRHSRGELVKAKTYEAKSGADQSFAIKLEGCVVPGQFAHKDESSDDEINSIALQVEFRNIGKEPVWVYAPCLVKGAQAQESLPELRTVPTFYRQIPRTMRKLWRGEPLHILVMGSSIDRGSANPPMYLYDEDPASPKFKQPLAEDLFDGKLVGHSELTDTVGEWRHYFAWAGRLRTELLTKFNYPPDKLLMHFMACDGSCISEATSGLAAYCGLQLPPNPEVNGQKPGKTWRELYPGLFDRPGGPGPDLVLFGSGANEKTDEPDEGAIFEATIRWVQRHYADCEFACTMWQRDRRYTPNTGQLMELSLNYQFPFIDLGDRMDQLANYANLYALTPSDGHPQATSHYVWFKTLEQAFEVADPIAPGVPQQHLPRRLYPTSYGWEGEVVSYEAKSPRIRGNMMVLDDTTVNLWGSGQGDTVPCLVDGEKKRDGRPQASRDIRNSMFAYGRLALGDRHLVELAGEPAKITAADCKVAPNRRFVPVDSKLWNLGGKAVSNFASEWGAPYGSKQVVLKAGDTITVEAVGTDLSVAWVDAASGGSFRAVVDGEDRLQVAANVPYKDTAGKEYFLENRRGLRDLGYGLHEVKIEVTQGTVAILGLFAYDARSNRQEERELLGMAAPGETVTFSPVFRARPVVTCAGGLSYRPTDLTPTQVKFGGTAPGTYRITGE